MLTKLERDVWVAWLRYYIETEEHDRTLPGIMAPDGCWVVRGDHRGESSRFARELLRTALATLDGIDGVTPSLVESARNRVVGMRLEAQKELREVLASSAEGENG